VFPQRREREETSDCDTRTFIARRYPLKEPYSPVFPQVEGTQRARIEAKHGLKIRGQRGIREEESTT